MVQISYKELENRLAIAEARLGAYEEQERRRLKQEAFIMEIKRCKDFLQANGFVVVSRSDGNYTCPMQQ